VCGICGILDFTDAPHTDTIEAMTAPLAHRGPDDRGAMAAGPVGLGHTRLSILDLSQRGHQPMTSADGRYTIVYNGEMYNFPELRQRLEAEGVTFRSRTDTEVVLEAWARWGAAAVRQFNGMFAFAVWDSHDRALHLARDRFGVKPLFFAPRRSGAVFGSEIKALLASGRIDRQIHWDALHEYMYFGYVMGRNTFFQGVQRLLPGKIVTIDERGVRESEYWSIFDVTSLAAAPDDAVAGIRERFEQAVRAHLVSDVPVGVFLSGGVDSSAVTAVASEHYGGRLQTFSAGFDWDRGVNELPKARSVAKRFDTEHHEIQVHAAAAQETIEELVRCHDEPFADAANIPLYMICRQLRGSIKVILQGDGGDEIFAGYRRHKLLANERLYALAGRIAALRARLPMSEKKRNRLRRQYGLMAPGEASLRTCFLLTDERKIDPPTRSLSGQARSLTEASDPFAFLQGLHHGLGDPDSLQRQLYIDCVTTLHQYLEKVDRSTMAHSVEVRVPFLDANLTEYAMQLPSRLKARGTQRKWVFRKAMRGLVPNAILDGRKTGFGVPYRHWLRTSLADYCRDVLTDPITTASGLFDPATVNAWLDDHISRRVDRGRRLYRLLNVALWYRLYMHSS